jgi:3',5'-cyclic AMP phosphodiesterase CpdA
MKKLLSVLILFAVTVWNSEAQKKDAPIPYFIIQLTDPQFGMYDENKSFEKETELFEKAISKVNQLKPDFVVITGDLVNVKDNRNQVAEFKRITAKIDSKIPVYYSPGNHDVGLPPTTQDIDRFRSDYGGDRFSFSHRKSTFIGINSVIIKGNTQPQEEEQFQWLKKELSKAKKAEHILIFTHYPFFLSLTDEREVYSNISPELRIKYFNLFNEYKVDAVFAGHLHNNSEVKMGNTSMITTSSVGKPLGKEPSGMRIIMVYPDAVESIYLGLDATPEQIIFLKK